MTTTISYYNHSTEEQPETNNILLFASANPVNETQENETYCGFKPGFFHRGNRLGLFG